MAIRNDWIVADTTARNALAVTDGDVAAGAECRVLADGITYKALRSGSGSACWSATSPIETGTWAPTLVAVTNIDSVTASGSFYTRIGNIVHGAIAGTLDCTAGAAFEFAVPLPVASAFTQTYHAAGACNGNGITFGRVLSDATNDRLTVTGTASGGAATGFYLVFMYKVL
jgi:hypothetical protein